MNEEVGNAMTLALASVLERVAEMVAERVTLKVKAEIDPPSPKYYNRKEAAEMLRVSLPTLAALTDKGRITAKRVARRVLYSADEIDRLVESGDPIKYCRR